MRHEVGARQCGPVQCLRRCLAERLNDIRENYGVPVSTVRLELTEQGALNSAGFKQVGLLKIWDLILLSMIMVRDFRTRPA